MLRGRGLLTLRLRDDARAAPGHGSLDAELPSVHAPARAATASAAADDDQLLDALAGQRELHVHYAVTAI